MNLSSVLLAGILILGCANAMAFDWSKAASDMQNEVTGQAEAEVAQETGTVDQASTQVAVSNNLDFSQGLEPALMSSLGVSEQQAAGGLGSLFGLAKDNLSSEEFGTLAKSVPGMDSLLNAAPSVSQNSSDFSNLLSDSSKALSGAQTLYQQFGELGLSTDQVGNYISVVSQYLDSEAGQATTSLFKKGVSSLL